MNTHPVALKLLAAQPLSGQDEAMLQASARRVQQARAAGTLDTLLQGRHVALMACADDAAARLFRQAGQEMGAQVALVPPLAADASAADLQAMGRLLGRLYAAVECQGMPASLVRDIAQATTVPVFDSLATARLSLQPPGGEPALAAPAPGQDLLPVQAVLLSVVN